MKELRASAEIGLKSDICLSEASFSNLKSLPLRLSDNPLHYTGREPERPGGHSFIPRTRAFHGNGDGRAEAIT